jgi:signal transduction histidine kinase
MLVSAVWIAPALLATIDSVAQPRLHGEPAPTIAELLFAGGDWLIYAILTPPIFWISDRWPIERPRIGRRVLLHLGVALAFCVAWALGGTALRLSLNWLLDPQRVRAFIAAQGDHFFLTLRTETLSWLFMTLPFGVIVYLCVMGFAHAIRYFLEAGERQVQLARLSEQLAATRFAALQAQLNPHFLFNTLNTIAVRARDGDGPGTARIVEQLSDVLRRTLSRHQASEVPLGEELALVRQYLAIEQARFPDTLRPVFEVDGSVVDAGVPSFAVQHLVENAVRHGIARLSGAGRLVLRAHREGNALRVVVQDDGPGTDEAQTARPGHGLENTRERLRALYGGAAALTISRAPEGGTIASLRVPYREMVLESNLADQ